MQSREILTPAQYAQEALYLERERDRTARSKKPVKRAADPQKQEPTPDALAVLQNEAGRRKVILSRQKFAISPRGRSNAS